MKTKLFILLILILSFRLISQDPGEMVKQCVNTLGGEDALRQFSDYQGEGEIKFNMFGGELPGKVKIIRTGRKSFTRIDFEIRGRTYRIITAFDGKTAWRESWGSISDSPSLNYESDLDHTVAVLLNKQALFSIDKETEIDGKKAIGITADVKGKKTLFFLDKDNHTILEIVFKDTYFDDKDTKEVIERRIRYGDYKKFGPFLFPTKSTLFRKGKKERTYRLEKITFNPPVLSSLFQRPVKKTDLRYYEERMD